MGQTIFISYSWANTDIADRIDKAFQPTGLVIKRDVREIGYKGSIKDYMQQVRSTDFVLLIISDSFLKSSNAMYEVLELLKEINFKDKILPVIVDGTKIYKPDDRLAYIKFWSDRHSDLELKLKSVNITDAIELYQDLKHYVKIRTTIGEFLYLLSDMNSPKFTELTEDNFQSIFNYIGVSDSILINEILAIRQFATDEEKDIEIDKLEEKYPNNSKIYVLKGIYSYERKQISKSIYYYRKSIELDPLFGASYFNLGFNIEVYEKDFDEAKILYEKAIDLEPNNTKAYTNLAGLYSSKFDNPTEARKLLEVALDINPYDAIVHYNLALLLHRDFKKPEQAMNHYELAIRIKKDFPDAKHNYGMLLWDEYKRYEDAKKQFLEILESQPNFKNTLKQLAKLLEFEYKHFKTAKIYYDRFIMIEPNEAKDHYWYATFLTFSFHSTHKELARSHYDTACSMDGSLKSEQAEILLG